METQQVLMIQALGVSSTVYHGESAGHVRKLDVRTTYVKGHEHRYG